MTKTRRGRARRLAVWLAVGCVVVGVGLPRRARAADWPMIQGSEEGRPDRAFVPFAFLQVVAEGIPASPVDGLEANALVPFNGRFAAFNVLSGEDVRYGLGVRRARVGVRGAVPKTDQAIVYFLAAEFGANAVTAGGERFALMDASVTFRTPVTFIRAGQFKLPLMDETLEAVHVTTDLVNYSIVARRLIVERPIDAEYLVGPANGFRDVGVELFGAPLLGNVELGYALMLANGRPGTLDPTSHKDIIGRLQLSWLWDTKKRFKARRDEVSLFGWSQWGKRNYLDGQKTRFRAGVGAQLQRKSLRVRLEGVWADGLITGGRKPAFAGEPLVVLPDATAYGVTSLVGWRFDNPLEVDLAANLLHQEPGGGPNERIFWEGIVGAQWFFTPRAKLMFNAALRGIEAPNPASADVDRILQTVAPRFSLEATVAF